MSKDSDYHRNLEKYMDNTQSVTQDSIKILWCWMKAGKKQSSLKQLWAFFLFLTVL